MAQPSRLRNTAPVPPKREPSNSRTNRRPAILAILLIACAALILIALATYNAGDEASGDIRLSHLWGVITGDQEAKRLSDTTHNGLGLVGSMVSEFLIRGTVGFSIYLFPVLLMLWGWTILRRGDFRRTITLTNYSIIWALLLSASFGMIRRIFPDSGPGVEWSGTVGEFLSNVLAQLLGRAGGSVVLVCGMFMAAMVGADLDVHQMVDRLRTGWLRLMDWVGRRRDAWQEARERRRVEAELAAAAEGGEEDGGNREGTEPLIPVRQVKAPVRITRAESDEPILDPVKEQTAAKPLVLNFGTTKDDTADNTGDTGEGAVAGPAPKGPGSAVEEIDYVFPSTDLLAAPKPGKEKIDEAELQANAELLRETLLQFAVELESVSVTPGPVVTLYELVPASGVKISSIVSLENDIALKLAAKGIRIMAPIPGKSAVGVEIPNAHASLVTIRSVLNSGVFRDAKAILPLAMGKTIAGEVFVDDLSRMPHVLMAGSTGSGKSVGINTMLASLLYRMHPSMLKLLIIDPKKIELSQYAKLKSHFLAVSPDINEEIVTTPGNAVLALKSAELEMERRYNFLSKAGVRNIQEYNEKLAAGKLKNTEEITHATMPFLVVIIDELADLMITAAREVEEPITRLAQMARAVGMHLIVATQRPSVDVITGVIKANFPARIAYQVASKTDSRTILDANGAEQLLGNGDMLYLASGSPKPIRLQNAYISPDEIDALMDHIASQQGYAQPFRMPSVIDKKRAGETGGDGDRDELFEDAARVIVRYQQGSVSLLQRRLKVGYSRAARLVDELEASGIVGPADGSKAREVLVSSEAELNALL